MVAKPVVLRTFRWETIGKAKEAFRGILHAYDLDEKVTDPTHDAMLRELLEQHPRAEEKTGVGVDHFYIGRTQQDDGAVRFGADAGFGFAVWMGARLTLGISPPSPARHRRPT